MKLRNLLGIALAVALFSAAAVAQLPSLANVGDDIYTSEEDGFEIAVPEGCIEMTKSTNERAYKCSLVEGVIVIQVQENLAKIKTDKDVRDYLAGFRSGFEKTLKVKLENESPAKIGEYRGASYSASLGENKAFVLALAWENLSLTILGQSYGSVPNSEAKVVKAVSSFAFNSDDE